MMQAQHLTPEEHPFITKSKAAALMGYRRNNAVQFPRLAYLFEDRLPGPRSISGNHTRPACLQLHLCHSKLTFFCSSTRSSEEDLVCFILLMSFPPSHSISKRQEVSSIHIK